MSSREYTRVTWLRHPSTSTRTGGRMLPDFVIIGAQRGGTTSLFHYLSQHPSLSLPTTKEIHYFDKNYELGDRWYRSHFPLCVRRSVHRNRGETLITGEASPYYLFHPHVPWRVRRCVPNAKLIVLVRNPVDRAYSQYRHEVRMGTESLTFADALDQEEDRLNKDIDRLQSDERYYSFAHQHYSYRARGVYVDQLQHWFELFPHDQILVLKSEDLYADTARVLDRVTLYLGVEPMTLTTFDKHNFGGQATMEPAIRRALVDYFRPHNQRLSVPLGQDLGWDS